MPVIARFAARDFVKGQQDDPLSMNIFIVEIIQQNMRMRTGCLYYPHWQL